MLSDESGASAASAMPEKPALVAVGSGRVLTHAELDGDAASVLHVLRGPAAGSDLTGDLAMPPRLALLERLVELRFDRQSRFLVMGVPVEDEAALRLALAVVELDATLVLLERFDPEAALVAIEQHRITHSGWSAGMLGRVASLPAEVRSRYDLRSHVAALHRGCPADVEELLLAWWGPILHECAEVPA